MNHEVGKPTRGKIVGAHGTDMGPCSAARSLFLICNVPCTASKQTSRRHGEGGTRRRIDVTHEHERGLPRLSYQAISGWCVPAQNMNQ